MGSSSSRLRTVRKARRRPCADRSLPRQIHPPGPALRLSIEPLAFTVRAPKRSRGLQGHDVFPTAATTVNKAEALLPRLGLEWIPVLLPVVADYWRQKCAFPYRHFAYRIHGNRLGAVARWRDGRGLWLRTSGSHGNEVCLAARREARHRHRHRTLSARYCEPHRKR
jgi:hypothetical protein